MILGFEVVFIGREHVPFNSGLLQTIATAFPGEEIVFYAAETHLAELRADPALMAHKNVVLRVNPVPLHRAGDPRQLSHWHWFGRIFQTLKAGLAAVPPGERCLVVVFNSKTPIIAAASLLAWRYRARLRGVQVVLHNNLNLITYGWLRWRFPWWRDAIRRGAASVALSVAPRNLAFLVLEPGIETELAKRLPRAGRRTDALPHPTNPAEFGHDGVRVLDEPVRIGFLGRVIVGRGRDIFDKLAQTARHKYGARMTFGFVGHLKTAEHRSSDTASMPRAEYLAGVSELHYILLPLAKNRYTLVASGALIDALNLRKPVIVSTTAYARRLFESFGDIGYLCDNEAQFEAAIDSIMRLDRQRYARQVEALGRARDSRTPAALAPRYRTIVEARFGAPVASPQA